MWTSQVSAALLLLRHRTTNKKKTRKKNRGPQSSCLLAPSPHQSLSVSFIFISRSILTQIRSPRGTDWAAAAHKQPLHRPPGLWLQSSSTHTPFPQSVRGRRHLIYLIRGEIEAISQPFSAANKVRSVCSRDQRRARRGGNFAQMKRSAGRPPPQQMRASGALGMMQPNLHAAGVQNTTAILPFVWKFFFMYFLQTN